MRLPPSGLDLETLVATRGPNFPFGEVGGAVDVPSLWESEGVMVVFEPPSNAAQMR